MRTEASQASVCGLSFTAAVMGGVLGLSIAAFDAVGLIALSLFVGGLVSFNRGIQSGRAFDLLVALMCGLSLLDYAVRSIVVGGQ